MRYAILFIGLAAGRYPRSRLPRTADFAGQFSIYIRRQIPVEIGKVGVSEHVDDRRLNNLWMIFASEGNV